MGHLFFHTISELQAALAETAEAFMTDQRKYTDVASVLQISEVVL